MNYHFNSVSDEFIKTKLTILFSIIGGLALISTILYNLIQYETIQKQNRVHEFEKKFYNRLDYLDGFVIPDLKYSNNRIVPRTKVVTGREVFSYFNEVFKRIYETDKIVVDYITAKNQSTQLRMLASVSENYSEFFNNENQGFDIFSFYIVTFEIIVELIHNNIDLTYDKKLSYFDLLYSQLDASQKFTMGLILGSNLFGNLTFKVRLYPEIMDKFVYNYIYMFQNNYMLNVN